MKFKNKIRVSRESRLQSNPPAPGWNIRFQKFDSIFELNRLRNRLRTVSPSRLRMI